MYGIVVPYKSNHSALAALPKTLKLNYLLYHRPKKCSDLQQLAAACSANSATRPPHVPVVQIQDRYHRRHRHLIILARRHQPLSNTQKQLQELVTRKGREQQVFRLGVQLRGQLWGLLLLPLRVLCPIIKLRENEDSKTPWGKL
jgi:hypothetical protein